ncbi:thioredoxin domain-containing protein [Methanosphaerula subterraneus]|uniref:thioredoxin domain-containing protein n=1 Tax=Methanosphaerula subterraneus TaxID=3350244 RepID=UPI003F82E29F
MTTPPEHLAETANRLIDQKSPYLLAHAHQPVAWFPWGEEAFARAAAEQKPVFLSIGYATCHWCHVMAEESFIDQEVATLLNDHYIAIKVDREERPDIDQIYMTVCQMMTGSGGWPLTIIMTPDRRPFFAATYIPKTSRFGGAGMLELLPKVAEVWREKPGDLLEVATRVVEALHQPARTGTGPEPTVDLLTAGYRALAAAFDPARGGFGDAPKFPAPHNLLFLLRYWRRSGEPAALAMVEQTLKAMRRGGIYDHLAGGFHRYSTDGGWKVPHFEKMLYDQAMLVIACTDAFLATGNAEYRETAEATIRYVLNSLSTSSGGFAAAQDADSEGEEGKYYLWTLEEVRKIVLPEEAAALTAAYLVTEQGNFTDPFHPGLIGRNVLYRSPDAPLQDPDPHLVTAEAKLAAARTGRVPPLTDDKVLTSWNGLMIAALSRAGRAFGVAEYIDAAGRAADFLLGTMRSPDGRLLHRSRDGEAAISAQAEDYAALIWGLLDLYQATFAVRYLADAVELMKEFIARTWDLAGGGFFSAAEDATDLIVRQKEQYDGAIPSANSVAFMDLLLLARLTGEPAYEEQAGTLGRFMAGVVERSPLIATFFLAGLDFALGPAQEVVVVGEEGAADTAAMIRALAERFLPVTTTQFKPAGGGADLAAVAPFTELLGMKEGRATAYVCSGQACAPPAVEVEAMLQVLGEVGNLHE